MALLPSESPAITVREVDLSGIVPAVTSSTGAIVGDFNWGPANQPVLIGNEAELVNTFGSPTLVVDSNNIDFLSASTFLKYSGSLYTVRGVDAAIHKNAVDSASGGTLVENLADWNTKKTGLATSQRLIAKYPGEAGNSLKVSICPWSPTDTAFNTWEYSDQFDAAPGTSSFVADRSIDSAGAHDELHIVLVDEGGKFTGTPGTVLESWPFLSMAKDAKTSDGSSNFVLDVLNNKSSYVWAAKLPAGLPVNTTAADFTALGVTKTTTYTASFKTGAQTKVPLGQNAYQTAFEGAFGDPDTTQIDFMIAPGLATSVDQATLVNSLTAIAQGVRKDCIVVTSPNRDAIVDVQNPSTVVTNILTFSKACTSSSYLVIDNNYLKVYDKYNDEYVYIPAAAATAGIMASTDNVAAPWFSPAGSRRGQYLGVSALAWNATKSQRDTLYKNAVNPIGNFPGQGILLFGDKTKLTRPSAFDRINVRRLFLVMERAIKQAAQTVMFEFNDEFTRAEFVNIVEPFLREIQGRRGITDFRVVCDDTNNTPDIIDTNQFVADIYVKPARSINYVTLSFVAVRTGVDFDEVVGIV
jgi:hypothetical protein